MKICMVAYTFYENDARVMRYAETLANRGHHVDFIALRSKGQLLYENIRGVNLFRIQERQVNERGKLSYLLRLLKFFVKSTIFLLKRTLKYKYQIIHVHSVPDFEVFAALFAKLRGAKIILDIHDIVPEFYASKFNTGHNAPIYKLLILVEKLSIAFSNHVIASNHIWKKTLTSRSVRNEKCSVLINYPDTSIFSEPKRVKTTDKFKMLYPGTLNWHQGLDIAIKAFSIMRDEVPHAEFHIYGGGPEKKRLTTLIKEYGLEERIFIKELVSIQVIAPVMASADLGIIPKRNDPFGGTAFSTKILEFMAVGVPVIASRTKIDEYYFDESMIMFFEPENAEDLAKCIIALYENPSKAQSLANNAQKFVNKNNWEAKKHIYLDLVGSLIARK